MELNKVHLIKRPLCILDLSSACLRAIVLEVSREEKNKLAAISSVEFLQLNRCGEKRTL